MNTTRILVSAAIAAAMAACGSDGGGDRDAATDAATDVEVEADAEPDEGHDTREDDGGELPSCTRDGDCDDGVFCNGQETCSDEGACEDGPPVDCDDSDPCTMDVCDEDAAACTYDALDADGDGFVAEQASDGTACGGDDCDDAADDVYPGAVDDECDLVDKDCDGDTSERIDDDGDDWIDDECTEMTEAGDYAGLGDCDDDGDHAPDMPADRIYPGAPEGCDETWDNDCDGDATEVDSDFDGDGYAPLDCEGGTDCDDTDASVHPDAAEECDLVDQDCDGTVFDAAGIDDDDDGVPAEECGGEDCDDGDATVHGAFDPATASSWVTDLAEGEAEEICDTVDQDCDGDVLDADDADDDDDGVLDDECGGDDCDDSDANVHPGAAETSCDLVDNDCDGDAVDGPADDDDDDYIDVDQCPGLATGTDDCDDTDADIHPGAAVNCDMVDDDCSGSWRDEAGADDDGDGVLDGDCGGDDCDDTDSDVYLGADRDCGDDHDCDTIPDDDSDEDGYTWDHCGGGDCDDDDAGIHPGAVVTCTAEDRDCNGNDDDDNDGDGSVREAGCGGDDCDDTDVTIHPGADLSCDAVDHDCNGNADEDNDGDGSVREAGCGGDDCDDDDAGIHPGAAITCVSADRDCNGAPDDDQDDDGYVRNGCAGGTDCDDDDDTIYPGAAIDCSSTDHDCNGNDDEDNDGDGSVREAGCGGDDCDDTDSAFYPGAAVTCTTDDRNCDGYPDDDQDGDGYVRGTAVGGWSGCGGDDCDDSNDGIHPGATEECDLVDDDCSGSYWDAPGIDDDGDMYADVSCFGLDCNDDMARVHPEPPPVAPDVCVIRDYDCDTIDDGAGATAAFRFDDSSGSTSWPRIAWSGSEYGAVWQDDRAGSTDVWFARLDVGGAIIGSSVAVTSSTGDQTDPDVDWHDGLWGIVYTDEATYESYRTTLDATGGSQSSVVLLDSGSACDYETEARIAGSPDGFGIVWRCADMLNGSQDIYYMTLRSDETTVGPEDISDETTDTQSDPDISWVVSRFGVVWRIETHAPRSDLYLDRVDPETGGDTGEVALTSLPADVDAVDPAVAGGTVNVTGADEPGFAVIWKRKWMNNDRLMSQVVELDSASFSSPLQVSTMNNVIRPQVAWDGSRYGVAWKDEPGTTNGIYFLQVGVDGAQEGPSSNLLVYNDMNAEAPHLVFDGINYAVVWYGYDDNHLYFSHLVCTY